LPRHSKWLNNRPRRNVIHEFRQRAQSAGLDALRRDL
jgi:hypothetical protein